MRASSVRRLMVAFLWAVSACECSSSVQKVKPSLTIDTSPLDFGLIAVGDTSAPLSVQLKANSGAPVTITNLKVTTTSGGESAFALDGPAPESVPPKSTIELGVTLRPSSVETYAGELTFNTDDPEVPQVRILLTGEGKSPQVKVTPNEIRLAAVACPAGATSDQCKDQESVTIENIGEVRLTLPSVKVVAAEGEQTRPPNLDLAKLVNTKTLEPGEKIDVSILWKPSGSQNQVGDFKAQLSIETNDPANPKVSIPVFAHSDPAGMPQACINVLSVTQRKYVPGQKDPQYVSVPPNIWLDDVSNPNLTHVRPGMKITFTTKRTKYITQYNAETMKDDVIDVQEDAAADASMPCTFDPTGLPITRTWSTPTKPPQSSAGVTGQSVQATMEVDAAGSYEVGLVVENSLHIKAMAQLSIDAQTRDDLFVQLDWQGAAGNDFDLHLIADRGPGVTTNGGLFCVQDCFPFFNPGPTWFSQSTGDMIPHILRDDQGTAQQLESVDLIKAPEGAPSRFRIAVHLYSPANKAAQTKPKVTIRHLGQLLGEFSPPTVMSKLNDTWFVAQVDFAGNGNAPTVTPLTGAVTTVPPPDLTKGPSNVCE